MGFYEVLDQVVELLRQRGRVTYRALKREFQLDDTFLEDLKDELIKAQRLAVDEQGDVLVWTGGSDPAPALGAPTPPPTARGEAFEQHPAAGTALPAPARPAEAERRQLTVLFCDLVDSTPLAGQLDPEDLREVILAYQTACATVIEGVDGHIAQYLGDGLLVYFGYPQAHEDDAQRAVRAGLGMVAALEALNAQLARRYRVQIAARVGIHTGQVVVGEMGAGSRQEHLALGDTPNLAARLQGLAAPDTVVLSAATFRLVQGYFTYQDLGVHSLKGVAAPVQVYRMLGESGVESRLEAGAQGRLTPLVGREEDVALLCQRWEQARAGQGQVVLLSGEAGIGKSRLVQVLKDHVAAEPHARMEWRGSSYHQQSPLYPVIMHLHRVLGEREDATPQAKLHTLERTLTAAGLALPEVVPLLAALLSLPLPASYAALTLPPQRQRQKTLEALLTWLDAEAKRQPVLVIVEDLHWIDPSMLELLSLLIDQGASTRLCLLLTARPEFRSPWAMVAHLTALTLRRFTPAQVARLATSVAGDKVLPPAVLEEVVRKTDGVPLFVEELTKVVLESGLLQERAERYDLTGPLPLLAIPATLHDALMARLDRLATAKLVAQLGAAIGRSFAYDLLQAVAPLEEATLQEALGQLREAELVVQRGVPPHATYTFKHALIQDTAYQSLLRITRQQYHQRIAQALETQFPETIMTQPELLAQHYTEAGLSAPAVGYWQRAGQHALKRSANVEAIAHVTKGLEVLAGLPETSARTEQELTLHLILGTALQTTKGNAAPEVKQTYVRVLELSQQVRESPQALQALLGLRGFYQVRGEFHTARALGEQAVALAPRVHDPDLVADADYALGHTLFSLGKFAVARGHFEHGVASAVLRPHRAVPWTSILHPEVSNRAILASSLGYMGYLDQALSQVQQGLALAQELAHPPSLEFALSHTARVHQLRREVPSAHAHAVAALAIAREQGFAQRVGGNTIVRGWALSMQGQAEEGIPQITQGIAAFRATGAEAWCHYWLGLLAEASGKAGQRAQGLTYLAEALALVMQNGECFYEAELHRLQGELLLQQPIPAVPQALTCFHQALDVARHQETKFLELRAAVSLARLWQRQGKRTEAYELLAPLYGWFTEGFDTADLQEAQALLATLV